MDEPKRQPARRTRRGFSRVRAARHRADAASSFRADEALSALKNAMQKIFIGQDGLRPVWRLVLYLIMFRALRFCLFVLLAYGLPDALFLWRQTAAELGLAIIALAPALLMARIEGRALRLLRPAAAQCLWQAFLGGRAVGNRARSLCCCWRCAELMLFISGLSHCTVCAR